MLFRRRQRQELWCHACEHYVQFVLDHSRDGNHVLECPNCKHEHCRVIKNGHITDIRWDQRNGPTIMVTQCTSSTFMVYSAGTYTNTMNCITFAAGGGGGSSST